MDYAQKSPAVAFDMLCRSARPFLILCALALTAQAPAPATAPLPWCAAIPLQQGSCRPLAVSATHTTLRLAVAATEPQREQGLMFVRSVPTGQGMLFVFPDGDQPRQFWMKNTITPLDMVFVKRSGVITSIAADVPATTPGTPDSKVARRGGMGTYVIELGAGDAARLGLVTGERLTIPAVDAQ